MSSFGSAGSRVGAGSASAAPTSSIPKPLAGSRPGWPMSRADRRRISATWPASSSGRAVQIQAAAPATSGAAKLVPEVSSPAVREALATVISSPGAAMSTYGERELNAATSARAVGRRSGDARAGGPPGSRAGCRDRRRCPMPRRRATLARPPPPSAYSIARSRGPPRLRLMTPRPARAAARIPFTISIDVELRALALRGVPRADHRLRVDADDARRRSPARRHRRDHRAVLAAERRGSCSLSALECWLARRTPGASTEMPESTTVTGTPGPGGTARRDRSRRATTPWPRAGRPSPRSAATAYVPTGCVNATAPSARSAPTTSPASAATTSQSRSRASTSARAGRRESDAAAAAVGVRAQRDEQSRRRRRRARARRAAAEGDGDGESGKGGEGWARTGGIAPLYGFDLRTG